MMTWRQLLSSEWLAIRTQIALGVIFIAAALPKIAQPPVFAKSVHAYYMLPDMLVNAQALLLPGVELTAGLALVLGIRPRAAAWVAAALLAMFMVALAWNGFVTENPVNCSCFDLHPAPKTCSQLLWEMKELVVRDLGILALAAHVIWVRGRAANRIDLATLALGAPRPPG
jgi:uncharacterized membrane protein YphA (DoxX/SURF4 family)